MEIEQELHRFVVETLLAGTDAANVTFDENLIGTGRIDSLSLLKLVGHVQQLYGIDLMAVGGPDDFESIRSMSAAVRRHGHA